MARLIYSKYSNERSRKFAIVTNIYRDEEIKYVEKRPLYPEGLSHIHNFPAYEKKLTEIFRDSGIRIQPVRLKDDSAIFEYIEGSTLEEKLNHILNMGLYDEAFKIIDDYFAVVRKACSGKQFVISDEFVRIFGKEEFPESAWCAELNNADLGFGNIVLTDTRMTLIDYEWCFDFPLPTEFILFRALLYLVYMSSRGEELRRRDIFSRYGYSVEDIEKYRRMENAFQKYISGNSVSIGDLKERMLRNTLNIHEMYSRAEAWNKNRKVQVYFDYGEGFFHENSYMSDIEREGEAISLKITDIPEKSRRIRVDVRKNQCLLYIKKIVGKQDEDLLNLCEVNGIAAGNGTYICNVPDPWVVISGGGFSEINFLFDVAELQDDLLMTAVQQGAALQQDSIQELRIITEQKENYINEQRVWLSEKDTIIREKEAKLNEKDTIISEKKAKLNEKDIIISEKKALISEKNTIISEKEAKLNEKDIIISEKNTIISEKEIQLRKRDTQIKGLTDALKRNSKNMNLCEDDLVNMLTGFLNRGLVRKLFHTYRKIRKIKNGE